MFLSDNGVVGQTCVCSMLDAKANRSGCHFRRTEASRTSLSHRILVYSNVSTDNLIVSEAILTLDDIFRQ